MKKVLLAALAFFAGTALFAEVQYKFYNKLYSDTLTVTHTNKDYAYPFSVYNNGYDDKDSHTDADFFGFGNRVYAEITTARVDAMVKADIVFDDFTGDDDYAFMWDSVVKDWYVEYRPFSFLTFGFHDSIYMQGSYLPVYDDNLYSGNIGSEGLTVIVTPPVLDNALRFSLTTPFTDTKENWLLADDDHVGDSHFNVGAGAVLTTDMVEIGATLQDMFDGNERTFGTYVYLPTLFGLNKRIDVGAGIAFSKDYVCDYNGNPTFYDYTVFGGVTGEKLTNLFVSYYGDSFSLNAEMVYNFGEDYSSPYLYWDFYTAASVSFSITNKLSATIVGKLLVDTKKGYGPEPTELKPYHVANVYAGEVLLDYALNKHNEFEVGCKTDLFDGNFVARFPVYWKYTF